MKILYAPSTSYRMLGSHILVQLTWIDILLGGDDHSEAHPDLDPSSSPSSTAELFFKRHPTAKIIVVIDTHCIENGGFVYAGNSPQTFQACLLPEVSVHPDCLRLPRLMGYEIINDCIPREILKFLSNASNTPRHSHKSIIINLACGASVEENLARHHLLQG